MDIMKGSVKGARFGLVSGLCILSMLALQPGHAASASIIRPFAGGGVGDGGPAVNANFNYPRNLASDGASGTLIADTKANRIRRVTADGIVRTVAGTGTQGYLDGGSATAAWLNQPEGVVGSLDGTFWIADTGNNTIRKVTSSGSISRISTNTDCRFGGDGGPVSSAYFCHPEGIALSPSGDLVIADTFNNRIRKVAPSGTITTIAGTGARGITGDGGPATAATFYNPTFVTFNPAGELIICDTYNHRVRKIDSSGVITTVAGTTAGFSGDGGPATSAALKDPFAVAFDVNGNMLIADTLNYRVRRVSTAGIITTVAGNGCQSCGYVVDGTQALSVGLYVPSGLQTLSSDEYLIADSGWNKVFKVDTAGVVSTFAGNFRTSFYAGDGGPAINAALTTPTVLTTDKWGNVYFADQSSAGLVRRVDRSSGIITTLAGGGNGHAGVPALSANISPVMGLAVDSSGILYIASGQNRIWKIDGAGILQTVTNDSCYYNCPLGDDGPANQAYVMGPMQMTFDGDGNLFVAESGRDSVRQIDRNGIIHTVAGGDHLNSLGYKDNLVDPEGVAVDDAGNLFIAETSRNRIAILDRTGVIRIYAGGGATVVPVYGAPALENFISSPRNLSVDSNGGLYFTMLGSNRVGYISPGDGSVLITVLPSPKASVNSANLYSFAGSEQAGYSGDYGPSATALLHGPTAAMFDAVSGKVYITDTVNSRIRVADAF
ncbi:MAG: hypothetical protein ABR507_08435 [Actinomycetota bacterium]|nr:hypothetical protein [Actinomycetota bacterium]